MIANFFALGNGGPAGIEPAPAKGHNTGYRGPESFFHPPFSLATYPAKTLPTLAVAVEYPGVWIPIFNASAHVYAAVRRAPFVFVDVDA